MSSITGSTTYTSAQPYATGLTQPDLNKKPDLQAYSDANTAGKVTLESASDKENNLAAVNSPKKDRTPSDTPSSSTKKRTRETTQLGLAAIDEASKNKTKSRLDFSNIEVKTEENATDSTTTTPAPDMGVPATPSFIVLTQDQVNTALAKLKTLHTFPVSSDPAVTPETRLLHILEIALNVINQSAGATEFIRLIVDIPGGQINLKISKKKSGFVFTARNRTLEDPKHGAIKKMHKAAYYSFSKEGWCDATNAAERTTNGGDARGLELLSYEAKVLSHLRKIKKPEDVNAHLLNRLDYSVYVGKNGKKGRIVTELVSSDLFEVLDKKILPFVERTGHLTPTQLWKHGNDAILDTAIRLAQSLEFFHKNTIEHFDIKPENIFVNSSLTKFFIGDLDTVRVNNDPEWRRSNLGTLNYLPPELLVYNLTSDEHKVNTPIGAYTDVWNLGLILFQMVTTVPAPWTQLFESLVNVSVVLSQVRHVVRSTSGNRPAGAAEQHRNLIVLGELVDRYMEPEKLATLFTYSQLIDKSTGISEMIHKNTMITNSIINLQDDLMSEEVLNGMDQYVYDELCSLQRDLTTRYNAVIKEISNMDRFDEPVMDLLRGIFNPDVNQRLNINQVIIKLQRLKTPVVTP